MICRHTNRGFTVLEMTLVITIIGILAAIAIPVYKEYNSRAYAADIMAQYDAIRQKAIATANDYDKNVCHWDSTYRSPQALGGAQQLDPASEEIQRIIKEGMSILPQGWAAIQSSFKSYGSATDVTLTLSYLGMGEPGANQARELARMFEKNGLFYKWKRNLATLAYFEVLLDTCTNVTNTLSAGGAASIGSPATQPQQPVQSNPQPVQPQQPMQSNPQPVQPQPVQPQQPVQSNPQPVQPQQPMQSNPQPTQPSQPSPAEQAQQCRDNCRVIYPHGNSRAYRECKASCN